MIFGSTKLFPIAKTAKLEVNQKSFTWNVNIDAKMELVLIEVGGIKIFL